MQSGWGGETNKNFLNAQSWNELFYQEIGELFFNFLIAFPFMAIKFGCNCFWFGPTKSFYRGTEHASVCTKYIMKVW